jgi:methylated-DNA-[protein]-cysteine S-methyltransferase
VTAIPIHTFPSELGWMALTWADSRLVRLTFGHPSAASATASIEADLELPVRQPDALPPWITDLAGRLQSYAAGNVERFDEVPLDLSYLSAFQATVVGACRKIGRGRVRSYGELAAAAGSPGAARAVGSTMAKNRFPIIIPCHRVVAAGGSIGGFSAREGVNLKRRMLELEGAAIGKASNGQRVNLRGARPPQRPFAAS